MTCTWWSPTTWNDCVSGTEQQDIVTPLIEITIIIIILAVAIALIFHFL